MLSRTAEGLFWMARYIERMDNMARLLDAGRRLDALPGREGAPSNEWTSIIIASGSSETFPDDPANATAVTVGAHLIRDESNPSSIKCCIDAARMNAKAVRPSLTSDVWEAINQTYGELQVHLANELDHTNLSAFLDWVRGRSALINGMMSETMLRNDRMGFVQLGKWFERADATARLLDVKYHVLLPDASDVGGGLDYLQWQEILRAANSNASFRLLYGRNLDHKGVIDLLVLNKNSPRSLRAAVAHLYSELEALGMTGDMTQQTLISEMRARYTRLMELEVDDIFAYGLHEWLTEFIAQINHLAGLSAVAFGFGAPEPEADSAGAQQS